MKKLGKIIAFVGVAGAALAGLWYFLDNVKGENSDSDCDVDEKDETEEERAYVSLEPAAEDKEALKKVVTDAVKENQAKAEEEADGVGLVKEDAAEKANDFEFESFDKDEDEE